MRVNATFEYLDDYSAGLPPCTNDFERTLSSFAGVIAGIGEYHQIGKTLMSPIQEGRTSVRFVRVSYASPLELEAIHRLEKLARPAMRAIKIALEAVLEHVMFYSQKRSRLDAQNALLWEEVFQKRLDNMKVAQKILQEAGLPTSDYQMIGLLNDVRRLSDGNFRLKTATVVLEASDGADDAGIRKAS